MNNKTQKKRGGWSIDKTYNLTHRIKTRKTYVSNPKPYKKYKKLSRFLNKTKYN